MRRWIEYAMIRPVMVPAGVQETCFAGKPLGDLRFAYRGLARAPGGLSIVNYTDALGRTLSRGSNRAGGSLRSRTPVCRAVFRRMVGCWR